MGAESFDFEQNPLFHIALPCLKNASKIWKESYGNEWNKHQSFY